MPSQTGYLELLLNSSAFNQDQKKTLIAFVREAFSTLSLGAPDETAAGAGHFRGALVPFTTSGTADTEVAVEHGLGRIPRLVLSGGMDPRTVNATTPTLTITRACDAKYLYVSSPIEHGSGHVYVE